MRALASFHSSQPAMFTTCNFPKPAKFSFSVLKLAVNAR